MKKPPKKNSETKSNSKQNEGQIDIEQRSTKENPETTQGIERGTT